MILSLACGQLSLVTLFTVQCFNFTVNLSVILLSHCVIRNSAVPFVSARSTLFRLLETMRVWQVEGGPFSTSAIRMCSR